jgi:hypothetical protein
MIGALSMDVANDEYLRKPCREILRVENTPGNLGIDGRIVAHYNLKQKYFKGYIEIVPVKQIFFTASNRRKQQKGISTVYKSVFIGSLRLVQDVVN